MVGGGGEKGENQGVGKLRGWGRGGRQKTTKRL